ncbi:MAG: hypothetical protein HY747_03390 [Elusimicrobia bacterium]|nr:hypothetical protein [Elusimicrobiota bacterium]
MLMTTRRRPEPRRPQLGIAGYYLQAGSAPAGSDLFDGDIGNVLTKTTTGAVDGQTYYARVKAKNGAGLYGDWSGNSNGIAVDLALPGAPSSIISASHPDQNVSYFNATPVFSVLGPDSDLSGIAGYYWKIDALSNTVPTSANSFLSSASILTSSLLADGTWYFHVIAKDGVGNIGTSAAHYKFIVKTTVDKTADNVFKSTEGVKVEIPQGALAGTGTPQIIIQIPVAAPPALPAGSIKATPVMRDISLSDGTKQFQKEVMITLPYAAADVAGMNESALKLFFYDETGGYWAMTPDSSADTVNKKVTGRVTHFTVFRIMEYSPGSGSVSGLSNYPNPFTPLNGETTRIRYTLQAAGDVRIKIFDPFGGFVWEKTLSSGASGARAGPNEVSWDGQTGDGRWVSVGGYICIVESGGGKEKTKVGVK